jgi:hypothetical protein
MGTDIYLFREKRVKGAWEYYGDFPYEGRDSDLFGWLNGDFQSSFKAIAPARGLPGDIAPGTKSRVKGIEGEEGCGESWLSFQEILTDVEGDPAKQERFKDFLGIIRYMCEDEDPAGHRIVFCFII